MKHSAGRSKMLNLILLAIVLTAFPVLILATGNDITVVVAVDDDNQEARLAIGKALSSTVFPDGERVKFVKEIVLSEETTEQQLCRDAITNGPSPTVMIDATLKPSMSGRRTSNLVKRFARNMGIPTISSGYSLGNEENVWQDLSQQEKEWLIHVHPPGDIIPTMVKDLANQFTMTTAVVFYDSSFVMDHKITSILEDTNTRYIIRKIGQDIEGLLGEVKAAKLINYFVLGSMETINKFLEAAQKQKMYGMQYGWYLITKSRGKVKCLTCHLGSVMLLQPMKATTTDYNHSTALTGLTLENKVDSYFYYDLARLVLTTISEIVAHDKWPAMTYPKCGEVMTTEQVNERLPMRLAKELSYESHHGQFGRFVFDEYATGLVYQETTMKMTRVEMWIDQPYRNVKSGEWVFGQPTGRFMFPTYLSSNTDLAGPATGTETVDKQPKLRVVIITQPPFIMKKLANEPHRVTHAKSDGDYYGYCIELLKEVQKKMANGSDPWKWDYELYEVPDGRFGEKLENGTWTGTIGELQYKRADMALGPIAVMAERETVVDFTVPYYDLVGINILMKKASVPSHLFKFLTVLETNVWFSILGAYFVVSTLIFIYDRLSPYSFYNNKDDWGPHEQRRDFSFKECLWFAMTSLTPQGGGEAPLNLSGRIAAGTWWLFGFIVIASYTANLAAFLTVSRLDSPIESLDHLSNQFRIRYAPQAKTQSLVYFERMAHIEHKFYEIWKNMSLNPETTPSERVKYAVWDYPISDKYTKMLAQMHQAGMPNSYEEGVRRTKESRSAQEGFAFVTEATQVKFAVITNCDLTTVGNEFSRKPLALVVQQNSTLKDKLSSAILKLLNERKLESLKEEWWDKYRIVCEDTKKSSDGISIHNIGGVFIVIFIGVILACITLVFEYLFLKRKKLANQVTQVTAGYNNIFKGTAGTTPAGPVNAPVAADPRLVAAGVPGSNM